MPADDPLEVSRATVADHAALASLRHRWRATEHGERGLDQAAFATALLGWMEEHRSTHVAFVARRGGRPVAMAWLAHVDRVPGPEHFVRRSGWLQSVYVVPEERSGGVGTTLLASVLAHARQLGLEYVAVHPSERSFSLYRRLGFEGSGRLLELRL